MIMRRRVQAVGMLALMGLLGLATVREAGARPAYFQAFTTRYGIVAGDRNYACGNCHLLWTGTGARNPFGSAVEQQLYIGKSITQALADIEPMDTDGDTFSNYDEVATFDTLAGLFLRQLLSRAGCAHRVRHLHHADGGRRVWSRSTFGSSRARQFHHQGRDDRYLSVQVINNGSTDPITLTSFAFLAGVTLPSG